MSSRYPVTAINFTGKYASKAIVGLARWAITDHTGTAKFLANMPSMGFIDTIKMILMLLLTSLMGAVVSGILFYLLIVYGVPMLLSM
jgi:hypothetical protein